MGCMFVARVDVGGDEGVALQTFKYTKSVSDVVSFAKPLQNLMVC